MRPLQGRGKMWIECVPGVFRPRGPDHPQHHYDPVGVASTLESYLPDIRAFIYWLFASDHFPLRNS